MRHAQVVVLGGDFRQTLPIVKKGSRAQIVEASHTRSRLWKQFGQNVFRLTDNMRVEHAAKEDGAHRETLQQFAEWLLALGDGRLEQDEEESGPHERPRRRKSSAVLMCSIGPTPQDCSWSQGS